MGKYRDLAHSHKPAGGSAANENFARENMELYTIGVGPYKEKDVRESARAFPARPVVEGEAKALPRALQRLERVVLRMQEQLGPQVWGKTTLIAMTEFGRTARENGSGGTDHGTGGTMLLAGGSLRGGRVFGRWPGLGEGDLYQGRDLMPTSDVRDRKSVV